MMRALKEVNTQVVSPQLKVEKESDSCASPRLEPNPQSHWIATWPLLFVMLFFCNILGMKRIKDPTTECFHACRDEKKLRNNAVHSRILLCNRIEFRANLHTALNNM